MHNISYRSKASRLLTRLAYYSQAIGFVLTPLRPSPSHDHCYHHCCHFFLLFSTAVVPSRLLYLEGLQSLDNLMSNLSNIFPHFCSGPCALTHKPNHAQRHLRVIMFFLVVMQLARIHT